MFQISMSVTQQPEKNIFQNTVKRENHSGPVIITAEPTGQAASGAGNRLIDTIRRLTQVWNGNIYYAGSSTPLFTAF